MQQNNEEPFMKSLLIAVTLFVSVAANAVEVFHQVQAKSQKGYSSFTGKKVGSCMYIMAQDGDDVAVYLNSDAAVNESIRLRKVDVPLQEGVIISKTGLEVDYKDGVLTMKKAVTTEGPINRDYQIMMVKVSPDLKTVTHGYVKKVLRGIFTHRVEGEMECNF